MHNRCLKLAMWAFDEACNKGYDCLTSHDWDDFKDCIEVAEKGIKTEYYHKIIEEMNTGSHTMTADMYKIHSTEQNTSNSEKARQKYLEHGTQESLDMYTKELTNELTEIWNTADNASRAIMKARFTTLVGKMA